jgi:hypothetical protein
MNAPARPTFGAIPLGPMTQPKDIDKMASAAKSYAVKDNIPILAHPRPVKLAGEGASAPASAPTAVPAADAPPYQRFTVELPNYLYEDIVKRIGTSKQTKKSIVLNAFHAAGFYVAAEDLITDGRRGK